MPSCSCIFLALLAARQSLRCQCKLRQMILSQNVHFHGLINERTMFAALLFICESRCHNKFSSIIHICAPQKSVGSAYQNYNKKRMRKEGKKSSRIWKCKLRERFLMPSWLSLIWWIAILFFISIKLFLMRRSSVATLTKWISTIKPHKSFRRGFLLEQIYTRNQQTQELEMQFENEARHGCSCSGVVDSTRKT